VHLVSPTSTAVTADPLGSLTAVLNTDTTASGTGGQLTWTYTVAAADIEYLKLDETRTESFTITLSDQQGSIITRQVDVTIIGTNETIAAPMIEDPRLPLISATGSTAMGRVVAQKVAARLGRSILELGGNNAIIVTPSADLKIAIPGIVFGAVGTCGQRCTTTRRLIVHDSIYDEVRNHLLQAYRQLDSRIGDPTEPGVLIGPMIDAGAVERFLEAMEALRNSGGTILHGGESVSGLPSRLYVRPTLAEARNEWPIVQQETFGPLLYLIRYQDFDEALEMQNGVPQGLSSAIFTRDLQESERFLSASGSDCGLANVNIGTSGAEIGGAFGGEKETGGGRESGSDAWKAYMRRQTNTLNYSSALPLAQGIRFDLD
ncbi:MAG: aldehyde dehydrogenase family protein, partial [bacterium]